MTDTAQRKVRDLQKSLDRVRGKTVSVDVLNRSFNDALDKLERDRSMGQRLVRRFAWWLLRRTGSKVQR
jgi:hypothetical protein